MSLNQSKKNKYDNMILILVASIATGYFGGGVLSVPNLLIVLFCLPSLLSNSKFFHNIHFVHVSVFLVSWLLFCFLSLIWTSHIIKGGMTVFLYFSRILMCFEILVFSFRAKTPLNSICDGWVLAVCLTTIVALWELITDHHLAIAKETDFNPIEMIVDKGHASVTFYNPNTYSMFLVMSFPFLMYRFLTSRKLSFLVPIFLVAYIILKNGSRGSILSLGIMLLIYILNGLKSRNSRIVALLFILFLTSVLLIFGEKLFAVFIVRMEMQGIQDNSRLEIWMGAWDLFVKSKGLGCGVGSMGVLLPSLNRFGIGYAHCMLLESMIEGGAFLLSLILYFLLKVIKSAFSEKNLSIKVLLFSVIIAFPVYTIINSEYLRPAFIWCFFFSTYIFSIYYKINSDCFRTI